MADPSQLDRARFGDADAIAGLLSQVLGSKGITVRGERLDDCLVLWLESDTLPEQTWVVNTIRLGMERLKVRSLRSLQIHCGHLQHPGRAWSEEFSLVDPVADRPPAEPEPSFEFAPRLALFVDDSILELEANYRALRDNPEASVQAIDEAYFQFKRELTRQGKRDAAAELKAAHALFKQNLQRAATQDQAVPSDTDVMMGMLDTLLELMRSRGLQGQARVHHSQLQIRLEPGSTQQPNRVAAIVYTLLEQPEFEALRVAQVSEVGIYGMASPQKIAWKRIIPMPLQAVSDSSDNRDLMSFRNHHINTFGFPVLMFLGIMMNAIPLVNFLLRGIKIWFHEFGHATIAWLAGRRAIPLPFGWTSVNPERSLFVYLGLLFLFGLMFWVGRREQKRWPMVLAGILILVQFWFTWLLSATRFETLLSFGGIGGEFYLCTLLMISFYFPLPAYWRWDFYRYPVVLGAAFTFWGQFWLWRQINRGLEDIPWGSMWGGPSDGDMNNLSNAGWSDQQIIGTYTQLSHLCLIALLGTYLYFGIRQNRHYLFALSQRWLARSS